MRRGKPELSVVIATRNRASALRAAAASVLGQRRAEVELIVVDDGSTDSTPETLRQLASQDSRVTVLRTGGCGRSAARNLGIERAEAEWVCCMDDDDLLAPEFAWRMFAAVHGREDAALSRWAIFRASLAAEICVENLLAESSRFHLQEDPWGPQPARLAPEDLFRSPRFPILALVVRRELLCDLGGFPPGVEHAEDYLVWMRLAARLGSLPVVPEVLVYVREHPGQTSCDLGGMARGTVEALRRALEEFPWLRRRVGRLAVRRRLASLQREIAYAELLAGRSGPALRAAAAALSAYPLELKAWFYLALAPAPSAHRGLRLTKERLARIVRRGR